MRRNQLARRSSKLECERERWHGEGSTLQGSVALQRRDTVLQVLRMCQATLRPYSCCGWQNGACELYSAIVAVPVVALFICLLCSSNWLAFRCSFFLFDGYTILVGITETIVSPPIHHETFRRFIIRGSEWKRIRGHRKEEAKRRNHGEECC